MTQIERTESRDFSSWDPSLFQQAQNRLREAGIERTPIKKSHWLSKAIEGEVYLKLENVHQGNSFKLRGATNFIYTYREKHGHFPSHVVTASGGNHGIAVAVACDKLHIPCIVVLPSNSITPTKLYILEQCYNAKVQVEGTNFKEANEFAQNLVKEKFPTGCYIHAYDHPWIIQGTGTIFTELIEQLDPLPEVIIGSLGGGGMLAGIVAARNANQLQQISIGSAETEGADYYYQSHQAGHLISLPRISSIAVTLGASTGTPETFQLFEEGVAYPMQVTDAEAVESIWQILNEERAFVEPSCSASVAALLKYKSEFKGKRVVIVLCGGSPNLEECLKWKATFAEATQ